MADLSSSGAGAWSSALAGKSDDEKVELLDRMLTRLALCDDSKLQDLLAKMLPLSIAALSSASAALRNKVIEILSHVNKRVKHQPIIGLPLSDLWKLYMESSSAPMVRNFCIVYIEMAIDRVQNEEKQLIAPVFLTNISKLPSQHQDILLKITAKDAMTHIWKSLIADSKKAIDEHLGLIFDDLLIQCGSRLWRSREASCLALADILQGRKFDQGAGIAIRPYLSDLVCCMLESLSSLEDQGMNYVEMHAENVGIQTEKLENLRISIARGSPMWETLEFCIDVVDSQCLEILVPRLSQLVRSGIGLNTRVGVANFISQLVQKVGLDIKPFTSMLLRLLLPVVKDERSASSRRAFANACAIVLKYAARSQAQKLIEDTARLHSGDRNDQIACAMLLKSYASTAADTLNGYQAVIVPVIFVSRFEDDKTISSLYEDLWDENMSNERITLQLFLEEIVNLINEGITSSSWASKKKASLGICKLSEVLGESLSSHHSVLLASLMKEIPGRLWEGKEVMLNALSALCSSCHEAISASNPDAPNAILSLISSACTKRTQKYREAAFCSLEEASERVFLSEEGSGGKDGILMMKAK